MIRIMEIGRVSPDDLQRALAVSPGFRLRYHLRLVEAMERETGARGIPLRPLLVAHSGETRPTDPVLGKLHAECAARGDACFDSARVIPAAEAARFTFRARPALEPGGAPADRGGPGGPARARPGAPARQNLAPTLNWTKGPESTSMRFWLRSL